jgi:hypothetical protein
MMVLRNHNVYAAFGTVVAIDACEQRISTEVNCRETRLLDRGHHHSADPE